MAAGAVPIVTRVGAIPDVVSDGVHGVFVPPRDPQAIAAAIATLASDRAALARMSAACRERIAAAYSIERLARDFAQLYWGVAPRARRGRPSPCAASPAGSPPRAARPTSAPCSRCSKPRSTAGPTARAAPLLRRPRQHRVVLGHRRLAIIDPRARRSRCDADAGLALTFNGEIFNFRELREELDARG